MTTIANSLDIYLHRTPMILDKTESLRQLPDYRFGHNPDAVLGGHIGCPAFRDGVQLLEDPGCLKHFT